MANETLFSTFEDIDQAQRSGALLVQLAKRELRFYCEDGQVVLLDLGQDKEELLGEICHLHHKIDAAMLHLARSMHAQGRRVAEVLIKQRALSEAEAAAVQRAMVEQVLVDAFAEPGTVTWLEAEDPAIEPFDLDTSALKIRIETRLLLDMVRVRLAERAAISAAIPDLAHPLSLSESAPDRSHLGELETHVLQLIDGQRSVLDLARALRESDENMAGVVKRLLEQDFLELRRSTPVGSLSGRNRALDPAQVGAAQVSAQPAAAPEPHSAPLAASFEVYTAAPEQARGGGRGLALGIATLVLAAVGLIGWVVMSHQATQAAVSSLQEELQRNTSNKAWDQAEATIAKALELAAGDVALEERLHRVTAEQRRVLAGVLERIRQQVSQGALEDARRALESLPEAIKSTSRLWDETLAADLHRTRSTYEEGRAELEAQRASLVEQMELLLASHQAEKAVVMIAENRPKFITDTLQERLKEWRNRTFGEVRTNERLSISARLRLLDEIERTDPDQTVRGQIASMRRSLGDQLDRLRLDLDTARKALEGGKITEAEQILARIQGEGTDAEFGAAIGQLLNQVDQVRQQRARLQQRLEESLVQDLQPEALRGTLAFLEQQVSAQPSLASDAGLQMVVGALTAVQGLSTLSLAEERESLQAMAQSEQYSEGVRALLSKRIETLDALEREALAALEQARQALRLRQAQVARSRFQLIIERLDWQRSTVVEDARRELAAADALASEQANDAKRLRDAMLVGDVLAVRSLAERLAMTELPLAVTTNPPGATVRVGDREVGQTPVLLDDLGGAARAEAQLTLILPGFDTVTVPAIEARSGWQIDVALSRSVAWQLQLGQRVSSVPTVLNNALWLAGSRGVYRVSQEQQVRVSVLSAAAGFEGGLENPVYAPVVADGPDVLLTTRDRFVARIGHDGAVQRLPIPLASDLPVVPFRSDLIVDRDLLIVGQAEGGVQAIQRGSGLVVWRVDGGALATAPALVHGHLCLVESDGRCLVFDPDNGLSLGETTLGTPVLSAWRTPAGIAGLTDSERFLYDGKQLQREALGMPVLGGAEQVILTAERRALVASESGWTEVGVQREKLSAAPLFWQGHAVLVSGRTVQVLGPRGFTLLGDHDWLQPVTWGSWLVLAASDGSIRCYEP